MNDTAKPIHTPWNAIRGFLIGMAELVPGISGGTVALVVGVYERALHAASALGGAFKTLVTGPDRAAGFRRRIAEVDWWLVLPMLIGMASAVLFAAGTIESLVSSNPVNARGLFFGLVAASLVVPFRLLPKRKNLAVDIVAFILAVAVAFFLVGFAGGGTVENPNLVFVFAAAAVAVCALVVPGVSGSFFLLAVGLYSPTLQAVDERDMTYISVFAVGAILGLLTVVRVMRVLLEKHRRMTLIIMAGLMLGSLRALWPWQGGAGSEEGYGSLLAPSDPLWPTVLALAGAIVVFILVAIEHAITKRRVGELPE